MSQSQPLDAPDPVTLDGLEHLYSQVEQELGNSAEASDSEATTPPGIKVHRELPSDLFTRGFDDVDEIIKQESTKSGATEQMEAAGSFDYARMRASATRKARVPTRPVPMSNRQVRADQLAPVGSTQEIEIQGKFVAEDDRVSRSDLVGLLEGFVKILRKDGESGALSLAKAQQMMMAQPDVQEIRVEDKTQELEEMRRLVIEAQETIIKLLTDRVEDRARIATLETELRLLPDLQEQADRAMSVAFKTEEFRSELHKVKYELERYRFASVRTQVDRGPRFWISRVRRWFLKAQGLTLRKYSADATRRIEHE